MHLPRQRDWGVRDALGGFGDSFLEAGGALPQENQIEDVAWQFSAACVSLLVALLKQFVFGNSFLFLEAGGVLPEADPPVHQPPRTCQGPR